MRDRDGVYRVTSIAGQVEEVYGRPRIADGELSIIRYIGGASMPEVEESRVSYSLANVWKWEKVANY